MMSQMTLLVESAANKEWFSKRTRDLILSPSRAALPTPGEKPGVAPPTSVETVKLTGLHAVEPTTDQLAGPHGTGAWVGNGQALPAGHGLGAVAPTTAEKKPDGHAVRRSAARHREKTHVGQLTRIVFESCLPRAPSVILGDDESGPGLSYPRRRKKIPVGRAHTD